MDIVRHSIDEFSKLIGVSRRTLRRWDRATKLTAARGDKTSPLGWRTRPYYTRAHIQQVFPELKTFDQVNAFIAERKARPNDARDLLLIVQSVVKKHPKSPPQPDLF